MASRFLKALGERIREMRKARGRSQEALAEASGFDRAVLGRIERGAKNITMTTASRIANALDVELSELLRELPRYDPADDVAE
jgi:transcriptional regulator with XRE-family HTH domain